MGQVNQSVTPSEARFAAGAMVLLTVLAAAVAGVVYGTQREFGLAGLFLLLASLGVLQVMHFMRIGRQG